ncbi:hypothetical protein V6N13_098478 [Hibiscus sabdariffa]
MSVKERDDETAATVTAAAAAASDDSATKPWTEELHAIRSLEDSTIRSARSLLHNSSTHLDSFQVSY